MILKEYEALLEAYSRAGGDRGILASREVGSLLIHENKVLGANRVEGLRLETEEFASGVRVRFLVEKGVRIEHPVHLCFGLLPQEGLQEIIMQVKMEEGSKVSVIAHCIFPNAVRVIHRMDAELEIGPGAEFNYQETHYHGELGGIEVIPKAKIRIAEKGVWRSSLSIVQGLVGKLDYDFEASCEEKAVAELLVKAYGKKDDELKVWERIHLNGRESRGLAKSRLVLIDRARGEVRGETYGNAPLARGHVDCLEIVNGEEAIARAIPIVEVRDRLAKVTHEAAIGSLDKKQIQTLMARGLEESEAIDVIVSGILRG
ncbi:MAG: SufD family Fe-S cluster assembly protein [Chloroflexi bacterium]|nr:MAG: SufD family Fe-S cluster assembly protein [Chloroflexota bacterium]